MAILIIQVEYFQKMNLGSIFKIFQKTKEEKPHLKRSYLFEDFQYAIHNRDADPVFITGVGRSGTHFLAELLNQSQNLNALHLDDVGNSAGDSFLMYTKWNKLNMDFQPFFSSRDYLVGKALEENKIFVESNPYLAFSLADLSQYYPKAKFIIVVREPRKVVLSHLNKGWYEGFTPNRVNMSLPPFFDYRYERANHFFGRIFPNEKEEFNEWCELTTVGKISWMWQTVNNEIQKSLKEIEEKRYQVISIDSFDFKTYTNCMSFLNCSDMVSKQSFDQIRERKPGRTKDIRFNSWGDVQENEFREQVSRFKGF